MITPRSKFEHPASVAKFIGETRSARPWVQVFSGGGREGEQAIRNGVKLRIHQILDRPLISSDLCWITNSGEWIVHRIPSLRLPRVSREGDLEGQTNKGEKRVGFWEELPLLCFRRNWCCAIAYMRVTVPYQYSQVISLMILRSHSVKVHPSLMAVQFSIK